MKFKNKILTVMFMLLLIIFIPVCIADSFSSFNKNPDLITGSALGNQAPNQSATIEHGFLNINWGPISNSIELPSPQDICTNKSEDIEEFLDFMESDLIDVLVQISTAIYAISIIFKTINTIVAAVQVCIFPGTPEAQGGICRIPVLGEIICAPIGILYSVLGKLDWFGSILAHLFMCGVSDRGTFFAWCKKSWFGFGEGTGYTLSPFENIYTAVACLCPTAVLFNLRKLKLIYQTFNCCIKSSCEKGVSVVGCYRYLDEETCMYWEGSLLDMLWDLIVSVAAYIIQQLFEKYLANYFGHVAKQIIQCVWDAVNGVLTILGLEDTWHFVEDQFSEPECSELLDKIGSIYTPSSTTQSMTLIDNNGLYYYIK